MKGSVKHYVDFDWLLAAWASVTGPLDGISAAHAHNRPLLSAVTVFYLTMRTR